MRVGSGTDTEYNKINSYCSPEINVSTKPLDFLNK